MIYRANCFTNVDVFHILKLQLNLLQCFLYFNTL